MSIAPLSVPSFCALALYWGGGLCDLEPDRIIGYKQINSYFLKRLFCLFSLYFDMFFYEDRPTSGGDILIMERLRQEVIETCYRLPLLTCAVVYQALSSPAHAKLRITQPASKEPLSASIRLFLCSVFQFPANFNLSGAGCIRKFMLPWLPSAIQWWFCFTERQARRNIN